VSRSTIWPHDRVVGPKAEGITPRARFLKDYAKNRRQDTLPLKPQTAAALEQYLSGKIPCAVAFDVPKRREVARVFRADLETARTAKLAEINSPKERMEFEQSNFLRYRDDARRVADFHSLRHTFITNLTAGGVHPKTAQALARHSTITLTMDRYSHTYRPALSDALNVLPDLSSAETASMAATGTVGKAENRPNLQDGSTLRLARSLALFHAETGNKRSTGNTNNASPKRHKPLKNQGFDSGEGEIRKLTTTVGDISKTPIKT